MKTFAFTAIVAATIACSAQAGTYNVSFKSVQNGQFVRAGVGPGTLLAAVSPKQDGGWGNFELVETVMSACYPDVIRMKDGTLRLYACDFLPEVGSFILSASKPAQ